MLTRTVHARLPEHDTERCASQLHAVAADTPLPGDAFDCLRCQYTFGADGIAHLVGTEYGRFSRALCDCCWSYLQAHPRSLARARRRWRVQGIAFAAEETALQTAALHALR